MTIGRSPSFVAHISEYLAKNNPMAELYGLEADPWEKENLTGRPESAEVEREMAARLARWMRETADPLLEGPVPSPVCMETLDDLRARLSGS